MASTRTERAIKLSQTPSTPESKPSSPASQRPVLRIKSLEKSYLQGQTKIPVLNGLELAVGSGETVAILGQSGAGKSTLLSLMAGLDRPDAGAIEIAGKDIVTMAEGQLAKFRGATLGIIFQQFHLMA